MIDKNKIDNPDDDLKGAPHLSKWSANTPFKSDADYFENFAANLQNQIDDFEEIKEEAPFLSAISKYNPFDVPENYFEDLPMLVQLKNIDTGSSFSFKEWFVQLVKPRFAIPVLATVLIAVSGINFMNKHAETEDTTTKEEVSVQEQLYDIDESTIIETLDPVASAESDNASMDDNTIENYLIDNNVDEVVLITI